VITNPFVDKFKELSPRYENKMINGG